ncbi:hydrogenase iron-sulfur subunit [candidate division WOR-3 bacterium]|nr:hydrogenase iron-sulfur subunit [candidate division WOR-3 bacterium]
MQYPTNTRTIRVLCTGQIDPTYLLKALKNGADGVLVIGCRLGECHYISGNYQAREKVDITKSILKKAGISPKRIEMRFISSAEGNKYIEAVKAFIDDIKAVGPSPAKSEEEGKTIGRKLDTLISCASAYRLRAISAKKTKIVEEGNVYNEKISTEEIEQVIEGTINAEFIRESIISCLKEIPHSCTEIAGKINVPSDIVLSHLAHLRRNNIIDVDRIEERAPYYKII